MKPVELAGRRLGRWTVIARVGSTAGKRSAWLCRCDCGTEKVVGSNALRGGPSGRSRSCGCLRAERMSRMTRTHGQTHSPTHRSWSSMVVRCTNPNVRGYDAYGGRGIRVCDRWRSFANFLADMGERPRGTTLDRIDVNGHYEPGNVRWATRKVNCRNRRSNVRITIGSETLTLAEWCERNGVPRDTARKRIEAGWPAANAVRARPRPKRPNGAGRRA